MIRHCTHAGLDAVPTQVAKTVDAAQSKKCQLFLASITLGVSALMPHKHQFNDVTVCKCINSKNFVFAFHDNPETQFLLRRAKRPNTNVTV